MYYIDELVAVVTRNLDRPLRITPSAQSVERLRGMDAEFRWFGDLFLPTTSKAGDMRVRDIVGVRDRSVQSLQTVECCADPLTDKNLAALKPATKDTVVERGDGSKGDGVDRKEAKTVEAVDRPKEQNLPAIESDSNEPPAEPPRAPSAPQIRVLPPPESKRRKRREVEAAPPPPPPPKPLKVIRRRKEEAPKVFETSAKTIPVAMLQGVEQSGDEE